LAIDFDPGPNPAVGDGPLIRWSRVRGRLMVRFADVLLMADVRDYGEGYLW
jgi:hypothetical protein